MKIMCSFNICSTCTTLVGGVDSGRSYAYVGTWSIQKLCALSAQFYFEPKISLKKKSLLEINTIHCIKKIKEENQII